MSISIHKAFFLHFCYQDNFLGQLSDKNGFGHWSMSLLSKLILESTNTVQHGFECFMFFMHIYNVILDAGISFKCWLVSCLKITMMCQKKKGNATWTLVFSSYLTLHNLQTEQSGSHFGILGL